MRLSKDHSMMRNGERKLAAAWGNWSIGYTKPMNGVLAEGLTAVLEAS